MRRETQEAEARTEQVSQEVKELQDLLAQKQRALEDKLEELNKCVFPDHHSQYTWQVVKHYRLAQHLLFPTRICLEG